MSGGMMRTAFAGAVVVLLVITFGSTAFSQTAIGFNGIGGEVGLVIPEGDIGNTVGLGVVSDLGTITEVIHLSASIDYWSKSYDVGSLWDSSFRQILIGGTASYYFPVTSVFKPYGGAGLNVTLSKATADYKALMTQAFTTHRFRTRISGYILWAV